MIMIGQGAGFAQPAPASAWKVFSLGAPALMISLPGEVTPMEASVPADLINRLERFDTYRLYHAEGKVVAVFKFIQYNAPIEENSVALLDKEITGVMKAIKAEQVMHEEKNIKLKKIPALQSSGSFLLHQQKWKFRDVLVLQDSSMWQVWIAAEDSDPGFAKTMNQVVKSIKF